MIYRSVNFQPQQVTRSRDVGHPACACLWHFPGKQGTKHMSNAMQPTSKSDVLRGRVVHVWKAPLSDFEIPAKHNLGLFQKLARSIEVSKVPCQISPFKRNGGLLRSAKQFGT